MARILRGDIYFADLNPAQGHEQSGFRPVLVISHHILNKNSGTVIVLAITSKKQMAGYPLSYPLPDDIGLPKKSWIKINQIRTISIQRLGTKIAHLTTDELAPIILGLNELIA